MALAGSPIGRKNASSKPKTGSDPKTPRMAGGSGIRPGRLKKKAVASSAARSSSMRPSSGMR